MKFTTKRNVLSAALFAMLTVSISGCYYHDRDRRDGYYDRYGRYHSYDRDDYWRDRYGRSRYDRNDDWRNR